MSCGSSAENVFMKNVSYTYVCFKIHQSPSVYGVCGVQKTLMKTFYGDSVQLTNVQGFAAQNAYFCLQIYVHYTYFAIGHDRLSTSIKLES